MAISGAVGAATGGLGAGASRFGRQAVNGLRGRGAGQPCRINSFVPGTAVVMADGTEQPIEEIQLGDRVLATDPATGQTSAEQVVATIVGTGEKDLVDIVVDDADPDLPGTVPAGHRHRRPPVWVPELGRWLSAIALRSDQRLAAATGDQAEIVSVRPRRASATVYNLTVANLHTFYVQTGDAELLTHNCGGGVKRHRQGWWAEAKVEYQRTVTPHAYGSLYIDEGMQVGGTVGSLVPSFGAMQRAWRRGRCPVGCEGCGAGSDNRSTTIVRGNLRSTVRGRTTPELPAAAPAHSTTSAPASAPVRGRRRGRTGDSDLTIVGGYETGS